MKPTLQINDESKGMNGARRRFPLTDFNYQSIDISSYNAHCADVTDNSFRTSREYFSNEANRDFIADSVVFGMILLAAAMPLLNGVTAIADLLRAGVGI